jgi:hypothetical protein
MATRKPSPQEIIDSVIVGEVGIDDALEQIEKRMAPYQKLADAKTQLLAARRALLGHGPRLTGGTTTKLTLDDVLGYLKEYPGAAPGQIAQRFGVAQTTVSSHLYRNKARIINKDGRYWARDPKNGLDTADDIQEDDDDE